MKRVLLFILAAMVLVGSSCSKTVDGDLASTDEITDVKLSDGENDLINNVLSDWFDYIYACEWLYGDILWAASYADQFLDNPTWDNLQIARTAVTTAERYIEKRGIDAPLMTADDYVKMLQDGYDVAVVEVSGESYEEFKQVVLSDCMILKSGLYDEVFWQETFDDFSNSVKIIKEYYIKQIEYLNITTEYLLLNLNDSAWTDKFHAFVEENCPNLTAYRVDSVKDMDTAYAMVASVLDDVQKITDKLVLQVGESQAALYKMEDAILGGDMSILKDNAVDIADMPLMLPYPVWDIVDDSKYYYYYNAEADKSHYPAEQETLSAKPDGLMAEYEKVSKEDFENYKTMLSRLGLDPSKESEADGEYKLTYYVGDVGFMLTRNEDKVTLFVPDGNVEFVPLWYIEN